MRLRNEQQLGVHLARDLAPVYLVGSDEPLLVQEACEAIRATARTRGYGEREVLHADAGFDWNRLLGEAQALLLFAERRLLELRLPTPKPREAGAAALQAYAARPPADTLLLVSTGRLDTATQNSAWVKAIDTAGVVLTLWPVAPGQLPQWVEQRMRSVGLQPTPDAARLLAERVEGNLLAAVQEIEKLRLLYERGPLDVQRMAAAVADSARYDVFTLADSALAAQPARAARVLAGLLAEGVDATLILWALVRELRALVALTYGERGGAPGRAPGAARLPEQRLRALQSALKRRPARQWRALLQRCHHLDRLIKGTAPGNVRDELLQLVLAVAGIDPLPPPRAPAHDGQRPLA